MGERSMSKAMEQIVDEYVRLNHRQGLEDSAKSEEPLIPNGIAEAELFVPNHLPALAAEHPELPALPRV